MHIKSVKMTISKNKIMRFFLMSQGPLNPKNQVPRSKGVTCIPLTDRQTDRQTDTLESDYRVHPFRVSGVFPSTYHHGSALSTCNQASIQFVELTGSMMSTID